MHHLFNISALLDALANLLNRLLEVETAISASLGLPQGMADMDEVIPLNMSGEAFRIVGIICLTLGPLVALVLITWLLLRHLQRVSRVRADLIRLSLETGQPLPDAFYNPRSRRNLSYGALLWIAWGLGLAIFFVCVGAWKVAPVCLIAVFIGVARLVAGRNDKAPATPQCPPPYTGNGPWTC